MNILKALTGRRITGNIGEEAAAKFLRRTGYKILERNYIMPEGEIDIICYKDKTFAFVEVKTRTEGKSHGFEPRPAASVTPEKQQKIIKAAAYYRTGVRREGRMRFDVIEVILDSGGSPTKINHLINTFDKNTAYAGAYRGK